MTNLQLYLAIGAPLFFNAVMLAILMGYMNAKIEGLRDNMNNRFDGVRDQFTAVNQRFDDMRELWRAELRRVEDVIDARLKHLEERER